MRYETMPCAYCGIPFTADDTVVVCPDCGAPHHTECWAKENRCACSARHAEGFVWEAPPVIPTIPVHPQSTEPVPMDGDTVVCPSCGSRVYHKVMYCPRCGCTLGNEGFHQDYTGTEEEMDRILNNYEKYGGLSPDAEVDGIPCKEYSVFVGGGFPGRVIRKVANAERMNSKVSWSFAAFFFGPFWFLYRKMVKEGLLLILIQVLLAAISVKLYLTPELTQELRAFFASVYESVESGEYENSAELQEGMLSENMRILEEANQNRSLASRLTLEGIRLTSELVLPIFCGLFGLWFYRKKVRREVSRLRESNPDPTAFYAQLKYKGGTSIGLAALGLLAYIVCFFGIGAVLLKDILPVI